MAGKNWPIATCLFVAVLTVGCKKNTGPSSETMAAGDQSPPPADGGQRGHEPGDGGIGRDLARFKKDTEKSALGFAKAMTETKVISDLEGRVEKCRKQVADALSAWERDEQLKRVRSNSDLPSVGAEYRAAEDHLRKRRDGLLRGSPDLLKGARKSVKEKLQGVTDKAALAKVEAEDLAALRDQFQKRLDDDFAAFAADVETARDRLLVKAKDATKDASAQQLGDNVLKRIKELKDEASKCPAAWDRNIELRPDTYVTRIYLTKLYRAGTVNDLPQDALVKVIDASLRTVDEFVSKSGLELCGKTDDAVVLRRLATKTALRSPEFRQTILVRLPALIAASGSNSTGDGTKLLEALAESYLADPQPAHAGDFDKAIKHVADAKVRMTKEFVWFLAAAAWSGSSEADRELFKLYTTEWRDFQTVSHRYEAAQKTKFNCLVGVLVAKRAGKDSTAAFRRCVTAIVPGVTDEDLLALRDFTAIRGVQDLNDFMCGWFAAVDPSFAPEALRIYKLVFEDPERQKLKGMEALLGGFESFRLGAISLALRTPDGLPVEFLYQVNKFHWQSERVVALTTLKETGRISKVQVEALKGVVDDPWAGTAQYPTGLLRRPKQQVHIDEWVFYGQMLEELSKDVAADAYLRAFVGQTAIRTSGQGEAAMYPYRIHALRRVVSLKPGAFPELLQFATSEKCPVALRRAVLCVYAADHGRIGEGHIDKVPAAMPRDGLSALSSWYVDGMLKGFDVVRTGKESSTIKSAEEEAVRGYVDVLLSYYRPELTKVAVAALKYKNIESKLATPAVAVDTADSEITPFHFMTRDTLLASAKRVKANENSERVADQYAKWAAKVWPAPDVTDVPNNAEEARKGFVAEHLAVETRPDRDSPGEALRAFQGEPKPENAARITRDWPWYEPDVLARAVKVLASEKDAVDKLGSFVSSVATGNPSVARGFDRPPNAALLVSQRAEVLEAVFADLQALEAGVSDPAKRRSLRQRVTQPILQFLDAGPRTVAKCREVAQ